MQHPRPVGPATNTAAPFSPEMAQGSQPDRPRLLLGARIPLPVSQTTPVSAPVSPEMAAGSIPPQNRAFVFPKLGWSVSQTTPTAAAFSLEMAQGAGVPRPRYTAPSHQGIQWWTPEVVAFGIESVIGAHPDQPRLFLGPRIPIPVSQTTPVEAPFGPEMVSGSAPPQSRSFVAPKLGWSVSQPTHTGAPFSVDMTQGSSSPSGRAPAPSRQGIQWWTPEVDAFGIESVRGWYPDRARIVMGPRIPLPASQPTHTAAAISVEMLAGVMPEKSRTRVPLHQGAQIWTVEVETFGIESVVGWHPDRARVLLGPRLGQPILPATHDSAAFSVEMVQGAIATRLARGLTHPTAWWIVPDFGSAFAYPDVIVIVGGDGQIVLVCADAETITVAADEDTIRVSSDTDTVIANPDEGTFRP